MTNPAPGGVNFSDPETGIEVTAQDSKEVELGSSDTKMEDAATGLVNLGATPLPRPVPCPPKRPPSVLQMMSKLMQKVQEEEEEDYDSLAD